MMLLPFMRQILLPVKTSQNSKGKTSFNLFYNRIVHMAEHTPTHRYSPIISCTCELEFSVIKYKILSPSFDENKFHENRLRRHLRVK